MHRDDGLANLLQFALVGHFGRVLDHDHFAIGLDHLVDHAGGGGDEVLVKFALQALLHDFHVQQAQETAAKAKAQRLRDFGLVVQRCVVELEFFKGVAQAVVLVGFGRVQTGKHLGLNLFEARQGLGGWAQVVGQLFLQGDSVAHLGGLQLLDARDDVTHLTSLERGARLVGWREHAQAARFVDRVAGHHADALVFDQLAIDHTHQHDHAHIGVEPAVNDHGPERRIGIALGRRYAGHHGFEDFIDAHAGFGRARNRVGRIDADHVFHFGAGVVGVGVGQVHFVEHRHHFDTQIKGCVAVGHSLRLNTLAGVDHQQSAFAGR